LKEHPGSSKWKDPEIVDDHRQFHARLHGIDGMNHVERFKNAQLRALEQSKKAPPSPPT
jgi:hypothetical protein